MRKAICSRRMPVGNPVHFCWIRILDHLSDVSQHCGILWLTLILQGPVVLDPPPPPPLSHASRHCGTGTAWPFYAKTASLLLCSVEVWDGKWEGDSATEKVSLIFLFEVTFLLLYAVVFRMHLGELWVFLEGYWGFPNKNIISGRQTSQKDRLSKRMLGLVGNRSSS